MTPIKAGACVQLTDESGWWRVIRVQGNVLHIADCATHHETSVSVHAVCCIEEHPGGPGS